MRAVVGLVPEPDTFGRVRDDSAYGPYGAPVWADETMRLQEM
jgi:hypothetical protein